MDGGGLVEPGTEGVDVPLGQLSWSSGGQQAPEGGGTAQGGGELGHTRGSSLGIGGEQGVEDRQPAAHVEGLGRRGAQGRLH